MKPTIKDCTCHWQLTDSNELNQYIGIAFGRNVMVFNNRCINLTRLLNDKSRIHNCVKIKHNIYVLLENNNLYKVKAGCDVYKFVRGNIKNIFVHDSEIYMLQNDGKILNHKFVVIYENISVVSNVSRTCDAPPFIFICDKNNKILNFREIEYSESFNHTLNNPNPVIDICFAGISVCVLYNNNTVNVYSLYGGLSTHPKLNNASSISAISPDEFGVICNNNDVMIDLLCHNDTEQNYKTHKAISIPNSPYCVQFDLQTMSYYPKYFMDRFIAFVRAAKYGYNVRLPKYICLMIANCLK